MSFRSFFFLLFIHIYINLHIYLYMCSFFSIDIFLHQCICVYTNCIFLYVVTSVSCIASIKENEKNIQKKNVLFSFILFFVVYLYFLAFLPDLSLWADTHIYILIIYVRFFFFFYCLSRP